MNTTPTTAPSLSIVGYGVEGASQFPQPMLVLAQTLTGARNPKQFVPLVRESDALAAIEAARKVPSVETGVNYLRAERNELHAECVRLRAVVVVQRQGLQSVAQWIDKIRGMYVNIDDINAAIAINGGEAQLVAGEVS